MRIKRAREKNEKNEKSKCTIGNEGEDKYISSESLISLLVLV
jgi:hypothetical protein